MMPTIATFGAGSARGFGAESKRFIYEFINTTDQATVGTNWNGQENFAYFSFGVVTSSNNMVFTNVTFNGTTGFLSQGANDNANGENKSIGIGAVNLSVPSTQTVLINATGTLSGSKVYSNFRILGGRSQPTVFYSSALGHQTWPYTYSIPNCKIGDIVLLGMSFRTNPSNTCATTATNMTAISTSTTMSFVQTFAAYVTSNGTFTTIIDGNNYNQQWVQAIVVLRAGT